MEKQGRHNEQQGKDGKKNKEATNLWRQVESTVLFNPEWYTGYITQDFSKTLKDFVLQKLHIRNKSGGVIHTGVFEAKALPLHQRLHPAPHKAGNDAIARETLHLKNQIRVRRG